MKVYQIPVGPMQNFSYIVEDESTHEAIVIDPSWDLEMEHFAKSIIENTPITKGTSTDALNVMKIIDEVYNLPIIHMNKIN